MAIFLTFQTSPMQEVSGRKSQPFKSKAKKVTNTFKSGYKKVTDIVKSGTKKIKDRVKYKGPSFLKSIISGRKSIIDGWTKIGKAGLKFMGKFYIYLRNKETQQTLRVIVSIQYDASF